MRGSGRGRLLIVRCASIVGGPRGPRGGFEGFKGEERSFTLKYPMAGRMGYGCSIHPMVGYLRVEYRPPIPASACELAHVDDPPYEVCARGGCYMRVRASERYVDSPEAGLSELKHSTVRMTLSGETITTIRGLYASRFLIVVLLDSQLVGADARGAPRPLRRAHPGRGRTRPIL